MNNRFHAVIPDPIAGPRPGIFNERSKAMAPEGLH